MSRGSSTIYLIKKNVLMPGCRITHRPPPCLHVFTWKGAITSRTNIHNHVRHHQRSAHPSYHHGVLSVRGGQGTKANQPGDRTAASTRQTRCPTWTETVAVGWVVGDSDVLWKGAHAKKIKLNLTFPNRYWWVGQIDVHQADAHYTWQWLFGRGQTRLY